MTSKLQSVKLEHIKVKENGVDLHCSLCNEDLIFENYEVDTKIALTFLTAHRHEDIKSLEKGK